MKSDYSVQFQFRLSQISSNQNHYNKNEFLLYLHRQFIRDNYLLKKMSAKNSTTEKNEIQKTRILFFADSHLGFDYPVRPKIQRRRRGDDFFNNYHELLKPAFEKKVDLVLHGGDMFFRARVHPSIVKKSFEPLLKIAESGIPVVIVPGNHERSFLPVSFFETHKNIFVFDVPKTFTFKINGLNLAFGGFACKRKEIRDSFSGLVQKSGLVNSDADFKFLCLHQTVEGAVVGVQNYTFRHGSDIIKGTDVPDGIDALLSGHIHRAQILRTDLQGKTLGAPVVYPGSIERTSFAEREETKGYFIIECIKGKQAQFQFQPLYARPMHLIEIELDKLSHEETDSMLRNVLSEIEPDSVVSFKPIGNYNSEKMKFFSQKYLRRISPESMNLEVSFPRTNLKKLTKSDM